MKKKNNKKKIFISIILFVILFGIVNAIPLSLYIPFWDLLVCDFQGNIIVFHLVRAILLFVVSNVVALLSWILCLNILNDYYNS